MPLGTRVATSSQLARALIKRGGFTSPKSCIHSQKRVKIKKNQSAMSLCRHDAPCFPGPRPHLQDIESGVGHRLVPLTPGFDDLRRYLHGCRYDAGDTRTYDESDQNNGIEGQTKAGQMGRISIGAAPAAGPQLFANLRPPAIRALRPPIFHQPQPYHVWFPVMRLNPQNRVNVTRKWASSAKK